jgi:hypothetical protein
MNHPSSRVLLALLLPVALAVVPSPAAEPMSLDDVVRLLDAEVGEEIIRKQMLRTESSIDLDVEDILRLQAAGASHELIAFLQDSGAGPAAAVPPAGDSLPGDEPLSPGVQVIQTRTEEGDDAVLLTNIEAGPPSARGERQVARPGVISSSERAAPAPSQDDPAEAVIFPGGGVPGPFPSLLPPTMEVIVRQEDDWTDERLADVEDRLEVLEDDLAPVEYEPEPVGSWLPQHPINDHESYPVVDAFWGVPVLTPIMLEPQEFIVVPAGPYLSFTGAAHAGFDPFGPVEPCQPGVACSVHQRMVTSATSSSPPPETKPPHPPRPPKQPRRR